MKKYLFLIILFLGCLTVPVNAIILNLGLTTDTSANVVFVFNRFIGNFNSSNGQNLPFVVNNNYRVLDAGTNSEITVDSTGYTGYFLIKWGTFYTFHYVTDDGFNTFYKNSFRLPTQVKRPAKKSPPILFNNSRRYDEY